MLVYTDRAARVQTAQWCSSLLFPCRRCGSACQLYTQRLVLQACKAQTHSAQDSRVRDKGSLQVNEGLPRISLCFFSRAATKRKGPKLLKANFCKRAKVCKLCVRAAFRSPEHRRPGEARGQGSPFTVRQSRLRTIWIKWGISSGNHLNVCARLREAELCLKKTNGFL